MAKKRAVAAKKASPAKKRAPATPVEPEPPAPRRTVEGDKAIAKNYSVSTRTIQNWRDAGLPFETVKPNWYRYDLDETDSWVETFRSQDSDQSPIQKLKYEIEEAKLRKELANAERLEREEEEAKGNILRRDEWESFAIELIQVCRGQLLQLGKQTRRHCCAKCQKTVPIELAKLVDKVLQKLARMREGPREE